MALPEGYDYKQYLPTEEDFALVLECKKNGNTVDLTKDFYPINGPFYYWGIRLYLACILLKWPEAGRLLENYLEYPDRYSSKDLEEIRNLAIRYKGLFLNAYNKYKEAGHSLESPEKVSQRAKDARKGEIQVKVKNPNGGFFRIIEYSMKYGDNDPTKKQSGARMHLYLNNKISDNTYSISIRGSNTFGSNRSETDEPFFATEQEARDFIANIDHQHIDTVVTLEDWRFVISDKPIKYYDKNINQTVTKSDLTGAKKVNTICGPCYMLKQCRFFESLEEKDMNEAIEKHNELNQKIFNGTELKPEVRQKVQDISNEYIKLLAEDNIILKIRDVILAGSNASYNYTDNSDLDVHILAETPNNTDPDQLYPKIYNAYRRIFESKYDISFYGVPVETYIEMADNSNLISNGIYSIMYNKWIKEPKETYVPQIDQKVIDKAAEPWVREAKELIKKANDNVADGDEEIDDYINRLYEMRQQGLYNAEGSEFSTENLIFKEVRNAGLLDKLKELKLTIISKKLSLEEGIKYLDDAHEFKDYGTGDAHETDVIDVKKASTFATQDLLDGSVDATYDGVVYDIVELTPTQYFELCSRSQGMSPDEIIEFISHDEQQLAHIKDVILKYGKKLPLPYISFSSVEEVSGQEGRHRMYALGEMFGWDEDFPVMLIQDASSKKTVGELLHESILEAFQMDEKTRREYIIKIAQIAHDQPIVHPNGIFELHNISEQDANFIIPNLRREPWIEYVSKTSGKYDYSKISYQGIPALKLNITGKIKFN